MGNILIPKLIKSLGTTLYNKYTKKTNICTTENKSGKKKKENKSGRVVIEKVGLPT